MPTRSPTGSEPRMTALSRVVARSDAHRWLRSSASSSARREPSRARDEDGVVAGDRARDLGQRRLVDRVGERGGEAARRVDHEHRAGGCSLADPAAQRRRELVEPAQVGGARQRVDQPAVAVPHLDEPELRDVARDGRLDGVDPVAAQRLGDLGLRRERLLLDEAQDRALPLELRRQRERLPQQVEAEGGLVAR